MESDQHPDLGDKIEAALQEPVSRRGVLKGFVKGGEIAAGVAIVAAVGEVERTLHPIRNIARRLGIGREKGEAERKIVSWVEDPMSLWPQSIKVGIDKEGLPVKGILPTGEEVKFDAAKAREARELAKRTQEPEIVDVVRMLASPEDRKEYEGEIEYTEAHPKVEKLPEDILSDEELAEKGLRIIPTDDYQLSIRRGAFDEGGPLNASIQAGGNMTIILIDGPAVARGFLSGETDKKFRDLIGEEENDISKYRKKAQEEIEDHIIKSRPGYTHYYDEWRAGKSEYSTFYANILLNAKSQREILYKYTSDAEVYAFMINHDVSGGADIRGRYFAPGTLPNPKDTAVFVAVGDLDESIMTTSDFAQLYFDHDDQLKVRTNFLKYRKLEAGASSTRGIVELSSLSETHPDDSSFSLRGSGSLTDPASYKYATSKNGFIIRHELAHHVLIADNPEGPNYSEYATDERAMQGIADAWKRWKGSNFKDDSGYNFVLQSQKDIILT